MRASLVAMTTCPQHFDCTLLRSFLTKVVSRVLKRLFNIGMPLVTGRWFTLMPHAGRITLVFGRPIEVSTKDSVDEVHQRYCDALTALYEEHKKEAGYEDVRLRIV
jgi:hypothetical protein